MHADQKQHGIPNQQGLIPTYGPPRLQEDYSIRLHSLRQRVWSQGCYPGQDGDPRGLDGVYRSGADGVPTFVEAGAPSDDELHALLHTVITRLMKMLTRHGVLVEEMGQIYLADPNADGDEARTLRPLQAAAITYRIAFGPRAGQKVLTLRGAMAREGMARELLCSDIDGFSLHAAVRIEAHDRKRLEQLCRYITRPALSDERVQLNAAGQVELKLKSPWCDGTTHLVMSPQEFMQRLAARLMGPRHDDGGAWPNTHLVTHRAGSCPAHPARGLVTGGC